MSGSLACPDCGESIAYPDRISERSGTSVACPQCGPKSLVIPRARAPKVDTLRRERSGLVNGCVVPRFLYQDATITLLDHLIFEALDRFCSDLGDCYPGRERLAEMVGCTERAVTNSIKRLRKVGAVRVSARYDHDTGRGSNRYELAGFEPFDEDDREVVGEHHRTRDHGGGQP